VRQCERDGDRDGDRDTNLHKQSCSHASPKIKVIVLAFKVRAQQRQGELSHDACKLLPNTVRTLH
jgi:hypothetical protein